MAAGRPAHDPRRRRAGQPLAAPGGRLHRRRGRGPRPTGSSACCPGRRGCTGRSCRRCGRRGGRARSAAPGCAPARSRPPAPPSAGRSRPRSSRTAGPRRAGSRAPSSRRRPRTRSGRGGPGGCGPAAPRRGAARWHAPGPAGRAAATDVGRPVRAAWRARGLGAVRRLLDLGHAAPVPGDPQRAQRGVDRRHAVGEPDLDEDVVGERAAGPGRASVREAARGVVGEGSEVRAVHAVSSSSSVPAAAARSIASPRETWAFSVPSGRPSTSASSA